MQDRFDKILKEKLDHLNPEYNSAHWNAMEKMLDNKGGRGFLYWKPLALIFAFLSVTAIGYYFLTEQNVNVVPVVLQSETELQNSSEKITGVNDHIENSVATQKDENSRSILSTKNVSENNSARDKSTKSELNQEKNQERSREQKQQVVNTAKPLKSLDNSNNNRMRNIAPEQSLAKSGAAKQKTPTLSQASNKTGTEERNLKEKEPGRTAVHNFEAEALNASISNNPSETMFGKSEVNVDPSSILESDFSLSNNVISQRQQPLWIASLTSAPMQSIVSTGGLNEDMTKLIEDDEILVPKSKSVVFNIGVATGVSESFIDNSRFSEPGFTAGVTTEVMFKNVIGISTGLFYTNVHYGTKNVICEKDARYVCPLAYRSNIKALEIPVNVRLNIVQHKRWNFYVSTGISNFIKLEESFGYDVPLQDTIPAQLPPSRNVPFNQSSASLATDEGLYAGTSTDFSLSDVKRYHLGYNASLGAEYRMSQRLSLTVQPSFGLSVKQVGIQDKRLLTYGVNARLSYFFGVQ